jgi:hypothetical protein
MKLPWCVHISSNGSLMWFAPRRVWVIWHSIFLWNMIYPFLGGWGKLIITELLGFLVLELSIGQLKSRNLTLVKNAAFSISQRSAMNITPTSLNVKILRLAQFSWGEVQRMFSMKWKEISMMQLELLEIFTNSQWFFLEEVL